MPCFAECEPLGTFDDALNAAIDRLKPNSLRTGPPTPNPSNECGDINERKAQSSQEKKYEPKVLGIEGCAEEKELAVLDVEKDGRLLETRNQGSATQSAMSPQKTRVCERVKRPFTSAGCG